jgi:hypothetical protein
MSEWVKGKDHIAPLRGAPPLAPRPSILAPHYFDDIPRNEV